MRLDNSYKVKVDPGFNKYVKKKLPKELKRALDQKIAFLAENPYHNSLNTECLSVSEKKLRELCVDQVYEFRVNMGFRCVFYVRHEQKIIILARVGNHDDIAQWF